MARIKPGENKLPPEERGKFTRCCICFEFTRNIHWHHTTPRALGGEESLQIPIDGDCHTTLHAKSEAVVSYLKGNREEPPGRFWDKWESEQRAQPYLEILVSAMLNPPVSDEDKKIRLAQPIVDLITRNQLDKLKQDLPGVTNIGQTIDYCIHYTLKHQGYKNEEASRTIVTNSRNQNGTPDLWGVRRVKRRKSDRR
ncbi:hypothetical protein BN7874_088 [Phage NCTB]|nr:hypothetical protein BN7874_088 [Phage NCTB]